MYVRIRRIAIHPGSQQEAHRIWRDQIIPDLQQQQGFHHIYLTQNEQANQIVIIFMWESKADAENWVSKATTQQLLAPLAPLTAAPPLTEEYDLVMEG